MTIEERIKILKEQIDLYEWQAEDINAMVNPRRYDEYQNTINSLKMVIKALEQELRWSPVSEGLPKVADCYTVTRQIGDDLIVSASYFDGINNWHDDKWINYERNYLTDVVAWMPLPQPYKTESEDNEND